MDKIGMVSLTAHEVVHLLIPGNNSAYEESLASYMGHRITDKEYRLDNAKDYYVDVSLPQNELRRK